MAERNNGSSRASTIKGGQTAMRDKESDMDESIPAGGYGDSSAPATGSSRGFLELYKPGQGYYTRVWTGAAVGLFICWGAQWLFKKLEVFNSRVLQVSFAVAVILGFGLWAYHLLGRSRKVGDFLIATEGEMKKVNWTSRREIIGSTKVVIFVVISMTVILFLVDLFFMAFFSGIGVLKGPGFIQTIRAMFGA
jgi:preprotein translocase SecE subunit